MKSTNASRSECVRAKLSCLTTTSIGICTQKRDDLSAEVDKDTCRLGRLWDITYGLVASEWQVARVLLERQFMDGDAFQDQWLKCRSAEGARRRTEGRLLRGGRSVAGAGRSCFWPCDGGFDELPGVFGGPALDQNCCHI